MSCLNDETIGEIVDGVADPQALAHLEGCAGCSEQVESQRRLGAALRALPLAAERAPAAVLATLRGLEAGARSEGQRRWRGVGGFVAAVAVAAALFISPTSGGVPEALADEAVSRHLRAFANGTSCEVESADPLWLAGWLQSNLGSAVHVPMGEGVELVGARRCSLFGEQAGAVVYRSGGSAVTMFVPAPGSEAERACEGAVGSCRDARDGQTVCVVAGRGGGPRVLVGELTASELGEVARGG